VTGKGFAHIADTNFDQFQNVLDVNVNGLFHVLGAVTTMMKTQEPRPVDPNLPVRGVSRGTIVNIASVSSLRGLPHAVSYTTSKHAVVGLTRVAGMHESFRGLID
jgi:NAD(P)-dependent dehydrogenase (short-subunit alcohol dehydrogenase family)